LNHCWLDSIVLLESPALLMVIVAWLVSFLCAVDGGRQNIEAVTEAAIATNRAATSKVLPATVTLVQSNPKHGG
jgi:hypothetical protein